MRRLLFISLLLLLAGCAMHRGELRAGDHLVPVVSVDPAPVEAAWRTVATEVDRQAIDALDTRWTDALHNAARRYAARLRQEGPLLDPAAAQPLPAMPPGPYFCRLVRLGGRIGYATYPPDICYVDGDATRESFTKQDGSSLPGGWLYTDGDANRLVFLGTNRLRRDQPAPAYGDLPGREMAGVIERVAPFRWRLVLTRSLNSTAEIELFELVPIPPVPPSAQGPRAAPVSERRMRVTKG